MRIKNLDLGEPETLYMVITDEGYPCALFSKKPDAELYKAAMQTPSYYEIEEWQVDEGAAELRDGKKPWQVQLDENGKMLAAFVSAGIYPPQRVTGDKTRTRLRGTFWATNPDEAIELAQIAMSELAEVD